MSAKKNVRFHSDRPLLAISHAPLPRTVPNATETTAVAIHATAVAKPAFPAAPNDAAIALQLHNPKI